MTKPSLTQARLREILDYNPFTGAFSWRHRLDVPQWWNTKHAGKPAGGILPNGRVYISINSGRYLAHRLAWVYMYGLQPLHEIDHINGDPTDNRICNLRDVTHVVNMQNQRRANKGSLAGAIGVSIHKPNGKYRATIRVAGAQRSLGYFDTVEDAHQAYLIAKREHHEGCAI